LPFKPFRANKAIKFYLHFLAFSLSLSLSLFLGFIYIFLFSSFIFFFLLILYMCVFVCFVHNMFIILRSAAFSCIIPILIFSFSIYPPFFFSCCVSLISNLYAKYRLKRHIFIYITFLLLLFNLFLPIVICSLALSLFLLCFSLTPSYYFFFIVLMTQIKKTNKIISNYWIILFVFVSSNH